MTRKTLLVAGLAMLCQATLASAQVININTTASNGSNQNVTVDETVFSATLAPQAYNGDTWNDLLGPPDSSGLTNGVLLDSQGNETTISVATTTPAGANNPGFTFSQPAADPDPSTGKFNANPIFQNYWAGNDQFNTGDPIGTSTITFSGLPGGETWDFYILAIGDTSGDPGGQGSSITLDGTTQETSGADTTVSTPTEGLNFVVFDNVVVPGSGELNIDITGTATNPNFVVLSGIQLVKDGTVIEVFEACDINTSGQCNSDDFAIIRDNLFQFDADTNPAGRADGDLNSDSLVDFADYRIFKDDALRVLGTDGFAALVAGVPEPSSAALLLVASLFAVRTRRRLPLQQVG